MPRVTVVLAEATAVLHGAGDVTVVNEVTDGNGQVERQFASTTVLILRPAPGRRRGDRFDCHAGRPEAVADGCRDQPGRRHLERPIRLLDPSPHDPGPWPHARDLAPLAPFGPDEIDPLSSRRGPSKSRILPEGQRDRHD